jgi:acetyl-CoA carboxylase biotin carboxyl carrier protein
VNLTNEDVADILAVLDSLPYDELDLQTSRFRLTLRRTSAGWTQSTEILAAPGDRVIPVISEVSGKIKGAENGGPDGGGGPDRAVGRAGSGGEAHGGRARGGRACGGEAAGGRELVAVRAPLPGTFYRAPRPGAEPFVEVGSRVSADSVVGIVETMKLMNSVHAGVAGTVAEICLGNAEFAAHGATLVRIEVDG